MRAELRIVGQRGVLLPHVDDGPLTAEAANKVVLLACAGRIQNHTIRERRHG